MQKLLITGGSGFLGHRSAVYFSKKFQVETPSHAQLDITDPICVQQFLQQSRPDIVLHCAAISNVGQCEQEPERSWNINVQGNVHIAQACRMIGAKCILCSSDQVYFGSTFSGPHSEEESLIPANVYGKEKLAAEQKCSAENPDSVLLRLSWMYDHQVFGSKEHGDFLRTLLEQLHTNIPLCYPIYDRRGITDVNEVIQNLEAAFQLPGGVYNFGSPNDCSTFDLMHQIFERLGLTPALCKNEQAFCTSPRNLCMDPTKAESFGIHFSCTEAALLHNLKDFL